ncbi:MAG: hypothetical protein AAFZ18_32840 [Myxococcota bacterium]
MTSLRLSPLLGLLILSLGPSCQAFGSECSATIDRCLRNCSLAESPPRIDERGPNQDPRTACEKRCHESCR